MGRRASMTRQGRKFGWGDSNLKRKRRKPQFLFETYLG